MSKKGKSAAAKPSKAQGGKNVARLVCAECSGKFETPISLSSFEMEVGRKFSCPNCSAVFELISLEQSRITVTILAKGETRTYGKTYDLSTKDYAKPL